MDQTPVTVIVVTSGKGGVGKTTTTANIGTALALRGNRVLVIDTDIGLRNLDVVMGLENRIVYDLVQVIEEVCMPNQAMIRDRNIKSLFLIPAAQTRDKSAVTAEQMQELCENRYESFGTMNQASKIEPVSLPEMAFRYRSGTLKPVVN